MPRSLALPSAHKLAEELERKNDFDIARTGRPALAVEAVSEVEKSGLAHSAASRASAGSPEVACHVTRLLCEMR